MKHPSLRVLLTTYLALMGLLALTVGCYFIPLGHWNMIIGMAVAVTKALLVIMVFMHVHYRTPLTRIMAAIGFMWLSILVGLALTDYLTRVDTPFNFYR